MLYAILCYNCEGAIGAWSKQYDDAVMADHEAIEQRLASEGKLGPVARLMPTTSAVTFRPGREPLILDGPFAETKEQLLGFCVVDCATLEEAIEAARPLSHEPGTMEIRPIRYFYPRYFNPEGPAP